MMFSTKAKSRCIKISLAILLSHAQNRKALNISGFMDMKKSRHTNLRKRRVVSRDFEKREHFRCKFFKNKNGFYSKQENCTFTWV